VSANRCVERIGLVAGMIIAASGSDGSPHGTDNHDGFIVVPARVASPSNPQATMRRKNHRPKADTSGRLANGRRQPMPFSSGKTWFKPTATIPQSLPVDTESTTAAASPENSNLDPQNSLYDTGNAEGSRHDDSFASRMKKVSLGSLLDDYGDFDPEWQRSDNSFLENNPGSSPCSPSPSSTAPPSSSQAIEGTSFVLPLASQAELSDTPNMLGTKGKAPVHVEIVSFGYIHGIPGDIRRSAAGGDDYTLPMGTTPFDCRESLPPVPPYVSWQDGLSGHVKRLVLASPMISSEARMNQLDHERAPRNQSAASVRTFLYNRIAVRLAEAISESMVVGGHGYASPLRMRVYVGSDSGRHRAVVVAETVATILRQFLRTGVVKRCSSDSVQDGGARTDPQQVESAIVFPVPCSIGTFHRELPDKNHGSNKKSSLQHRHNSLKPSSKQAALEEGF
jgi:hypothetical protein